MVQQESQFVNFRKEAINIPFGFLMGAADIIPGVSGGTVALIFGIYERLVKSISQFDVELLRLIRQRKFRQIVDHIDLQFLIVLFVGILCGVGVMSLLMKYLLIHKLQETLAAFFGLILASSWIVSRMIPKWSPVLLTLLIAGLLFAYLLVGSEALQHPPQSNFYLFFCGTLSICAMILPGISGAFILLILGHYSTITDIIHNILHGEVEIDQLFSFACFTFGTVVGILSFSKILRWLLEHYRLPMLALLCGFMLGSLRKLWPFFEDTTPSITDLKKKVLEVVQPDFSSYETWLVILVMSISFGLVILIEFFAIKLQQNRRTE